MKRSITTWTTTLATAALLGLPIAAAARTQQPDSPPPQQQPAPQPTQPQQPQPTQPQQPAPQPTQPPTQPQPQPQPTEPQPTQPPAQPPAQPQPTEPQPTAPPATTQQPTTSASPQTPDQSVSPEEHLRQARAAFSEIKMQSIPARDRAQFAELRRHLAALDNPSSAQASSRATARRGTKAGAGSASANNSWGTEVAAIDRIITTLAGSEAAGTSGTGTAGATGTAGRSRSTSNVAVDDATRAKLMEIRTHITAYAAAKSGTSSTPRGEAANMTNEVTTPSAQPANATAGETPRTGNYPANGTTGQPSTTSPQAGSAPSAQSPTAQPQDTPPSAQGNMAQGAKVDTEAAHRELLAARDALNQLTQLPAAAQLAGEARTQVQQLITNFNELITNNADWRPSYGKVASTLTALLGPDNTDAEATAGAPTTATGAAPATGAVGTSGGAVQLDPAIRAKLVEMRTHLNEFQKASGGMAK